MATKAAIRNAAVHARALADQELGRAKARHIEATRVAADALVDLQRAMMKYCDAAEDARRVK